MARLLPPLRSRSIAVLLVSVLSGLPGCGGLATSGERNESGAGNAPNGSTGLPPPPIPERTLGETCEDNPLLAGCPQPQSAATCPENPLACPLLPEPPPRRPPSLEPPRRSDDLSLPYVVRMEALLEEECGSCHGAQARRSCTGTCDGMLYIDDMMQLLDNEQILPCDWQGSRIARRVRDSSMPPRSSGLPPMPVRAQEQLEVFVANMCTELLYPGNVALSQAQQVLVESCGSCHGAPVDAGPPAGGLPRVDDVQALIDGGFLIPCRSQASPLIFAIQSGSMPPPESGLAPMSAAQLATLTQFIDRPCAR